VTPTVPVRSADCAPQQARYMVELRGDVGPVRRGAAGCEAARRDAVEPDASPRTSAASALSRADA